MVLGQNTLPLGTKNWSPNLVDNLGGTGLGTYPKMIIHDQTKKSSWFKSSLSPLWVFDVGTLDESSCGLAYRTCSQGSRSPQETPAFIDDRQHDAQPRILILCL